MSRSGDMYLQMEEAGLTTEYQVEDMMNDPDYKKWYEKQLNDYIGSKEHTEWMKSFMSDEPVF